MNKVRIEYPDTEYCMISDWKLFDENGQDTFKNVDQIEMTLMSEYTDDDGNKYSSFIFNIADAIQREIIDILKISSCIIKMRHVYIQSEGEPK